MAPFCSYILVRTEFGKNSEQIKDFRNALVRSLSASWGPKVAEILYGRNRFLTEGILTKMKTKTNTKITLERRRRITIRLRRRWLSTRWCTGCAAEVEMFAPEEAAFVSGATQR